jgi:hypothetical protein
MATHVPFALALALAGTATIAGCTADDAHGLSEQANRDEEAVLAPPQVGTRGGPVLRAPRIVAAVFEGDPLAGEIQTFVSEMANHPGYWSAGTAEYGVGPLRGASTVVVHERPPASATSRQVHDWIVAHTTGDRPLLGAFDAQTMYTVFYPSTTNVILEGSGPQCTAFGGYHLDERYGDDRPLVYVAIPRCPPMGELSTLDLMTTAASHEWLEGAADPYPAFAPAYSVIDADHSAWAVSFSDLPIAEIGDMCALVPSLMTTPAGFTHRVQRVWSNAAARAGGDRCVPAPAEPYFASTPALRDDVTISIPIPGATPLRTKGVKIPVGESRTIDVALSSTAVGDPWTVFAADLRAETGEPTRLVFSWDGAAAAQGKRGDSLHLTITAVGTGPLGGAPFAVYSTRGATTQIAIGFVQN